jgi:hypothetical protein
MAKDDKPRDLMGYEALQQEALRGVIRLALARAAGPRGLPGDHHFYISFRSDAAGVSIPPDLRARYPQEMTIVLQNQYWDLAPGETSFSVTLQFGGQPKGLTSPYAAVTRFYDPSIHYLLQFGAPPPARQGAPFSLSPAQGARAQPRQAAEPPQPPQPPPPKAQTPKVDGPKIVSLDQFRKK